MQESGTAFAHLLLLVSRGQALLAELFRLSDKVPPVFNPELEAKYAEVLFDFRYLKATEYYESKLESETRLLELDDEFRENNLPILERFFQLFEGIIRYYQDLMRFLEDLQEGMYIQQTFEGLLTDPEGKQLIVEAFYLHGALLQLLDLRIDPSVKERMVISFYRFKGATDIPNIDDVIKMCRATGHTAGQVKQTHGYPEQYFARFPLPVKVVRMVLGRIRLDDVYNQIRHYPNPEHRSTALAQQAAYLYILLYFVPDILHDETAVMREIVDKHYVDNWVIPFSLGHTVDLSVEWKPYQAAKLALDNVITPSLAKKLQYEHVSRLPGLLTELAGFLTEGVLTEEFILCNHDQILGTLRNCNVAIQWLMLHAVTRNKKIREAMYQGAPAADLVVSVLLDVAELEFRVKSLYEKLLDSKMTRWDEAKTDAANCIIELAEFFSGAKVLARKIKDDNLQKWFDSIAGEVRKLAYTEPVSAGRKIQQMINALEDVEQFHQFDGILQTKQYLADTRSHLTRMVRIANVQESFLASFEVVSDMSYAWGHIINAYTAQMHDRIRRDPFSTLKLRCLFLKLKSIMELPLLRISQCNSGDLLSVSEYYSNMLINYVRMVLEVIPRTMFETLNVIIQVQTKKLKELPTRLEKDRLREFAQLDERFQLAQATHSISAFTHGILAMEQTLLGVIQIEPKKLLEDGIRKQLVLRISDICHTELVFVQKEVGMFSTRIIELDFQQCLHNVATQLAGFRRSFEYIQDYVNIYGLRVWQEEFQRIINYNVEQECNTFLKKQVPDWQSSYQSTSIPIPRHKPLEGDSSVNFMGRLTRELLRQTNPEKTLYLYPLSGWFDYEGKEVVGIRMFALLKESVGVLGLSGIDKLLCFMVVHRLQQLVTLLRSPKLESTWKDTVRRFHAQVEPLGGLPEAGIALYEETLSKMPKIWGAFLTTTAFLGQAQLLRRQCSVELSSTCKLDSNSLSCALEATNTALLTDIQAHYKAPESKPYPEASPILPEVAKYLTAAGIHNPISQIYITTDPLDDLPVLAFLFTLTQLPKYYVDSHLSVLAPKGRKSGPNGTVDCCPLVIGVLTLLRQFHSSHTQTFIQYMAQYIRVLLQPAKGGGSSDQRSPNSAFSVETACAIQFLEDLTRYGQIAREVVQMYVPPFVIDHRD